MKKLSTHPHGSMIRHGFTLVELLIVMAILVLLVSMVGPRLLGSKEKADISSVTTQIGMFKSALERYHLDNSGYPSSEQGLAALIAVPSGGDSMDDELGGGDEEGYELEADDDSGAAGGGRSSWDGPYLKSETLPKDPWGNKYRYEYPPTHGRLDEPDIWSYGPDRKEDTDDDITSWTGDGKGGEEGSDFGGDDQDE